MKLSETQKAALAQIHNAPIMVGYEAFAGVAPNTVESLEKKGQIETRGVRAVRWVLSPEGEETIRELVAAGELEIEQPGKK